MDKTKSDTEFEILVRRLEKRLEDCDLPIHNASSLALYLHHGCLPGSFMTAVLENNLVEAASNADHRNKHFLFEWANFLYNHMPTDTWGSKEKVDAYVQSKQSPREGAQ